MPRRYNLRNRNQDVKWIEDETLKTKEEIESEEEDEDYEPPSESEEEEEESEPESEQEEAPQQSITIPVFKHGFIKIEIDNRPIAPSIEEESDYEDDDEEEEEESGGEFLNYLMNKYVPRSRLIKKSKKDKDDDEPAMELNEEEQEYFDELPKSKQRKLNKQMKQLAELVKDGDKPHKFRVLDLPVADSVKANVIKKLDTLAEMEEGGNDTYKLRTWIDGFLRIPFGVNVPLPVKLDDGAKPCAKFLSETRHTLDKAVYGMQSAKTQIMQILAQWISNPNSVGNVIALKGPMGVGKCHAKDTPILMYDGSIKLVQDIEIGDTIMGDDSTPRKVTNLGRGRDIMYNIVPTGRGETYTVNSEHILCLKQSGIGCIRVKHRQDTPAFQTRRFDSNEKTLKYKTFETYEEAEGYLNSFKEEDNITEISVKDYLNLTTEVKKNWLKGYRTGVEFPSKSIEFDPYILGVWLGDGTSSKAEITNQDAAVLGYLHTHLRKYDLMLNFSERYSYRIISMDSRKKGGNYMLEFLKKHNLLNNKHIPDVYKINDRDIRLNVLAGLIDTDGTLQHNGFEITQKNKQLADDIVFLARSLGFTANMSECEKSCQYLGETRTGTYYRIHIWGDLSEVPVRIQRKKANIRLQEKNHLVYGFDVKCVGEGDYYGFTLDGNQRYLMGDFTVTHNTSFAKNGVATVLKRPFEFFSLGGATDSANFVGHSYTYEGSMWGRIIDSLMNARCMNPVMYFDELDKISTTPHGEEIVSMLIHMTDRSQNSQFHDRYFAGVDIDLSQCLFVFSFNDESKVHPILKDRMQVINCSGYSSDEKKIILSQYVWPQILERINMVNDLKINDEAVKHLINEYSKEEEGVRTLIRAVETLVTRINLLRIADEETAKSYKFYTKIEVPLTIDTTLARHILQDLNTQPNESWRHLYT